jgi:hypothetical protein
MVAANACETGKPFKAGIAARTVAIVYPGCCFRDHHGENRLAGTVAGRSARAAQPEVARLRGGRAGGDGGRDGFPARAARDGGPARVRDGSYSR